MIKIKINFFYETYFGYKINIKMKAAERRKKRLQEKKNKQNLGLDKNEVGEKILTPLKKENFGNPENINEFNLNKNIKDVTISKPSKNTDIEKTSQKIRERKERGRRKKNTMDSDVTSEIGFNDKNSNKNINENISIKKTNSNNSINKNFINEKDSKQLLEALEPIPPISQKKVNFNIPSNKSLNINNIDLNNKPNSNSSSNSNNSIKINNFNINNNDIPSTLPIPNYQLLEKQIPNIKKENVDDFLKKTNPDKPSDEQKQSEVKRMIQVMNLRPNPKNSYNQVILNDKNKYAYNLTQKIEDNYDYYENQKEINELREQVKEEEKNLEEKLKRNREEIQKKIEKIIYLQNKLINSEQGDIVALEEENKIYEIQINNYLVTLKRLEEENMKEKKRMHSLINEEIIPLQKELKAEINEVRNLKNQLKFMNKKVPPKDILKKIEVVMKYMKHCT